MPIYIKSQEWEKDVSTWIRMLPPIPTRLLYRHCEKCHTVNRYTKAFDRETSNDLGD